MNSLLTVVINLVLLIGIAVILFYAVAFIIVDPRFLQIARVIVGILAFVLIVQQVAGVLGAGGSKTISTEQFMWFGICVLGILAVAYVIQYFLGKASGVIPFMDLLQFLVGVVFLIALLGAAYTVLFGGGGFANFRMRSDISPPFQVARAAGFTAATASIR